MYNLFSSRYKDILDDNDFSIDLNDTSKLRLIRKLMEFDEPIKKNVSRYDNYMVDSSTRIEVFEQYFDAKNMDQPSEGRQQDDEKWLFEKENSVLFDFIELWFDNLSDREQRDFQEEINFLLHDSKAPWFLLNGKIIKQDAKQFERDLIEQSLEKISEYPEFNKVVKEFEEALMHYNLNDYKKTILYCEMSYESLLKIICSINEGQAAQLTNAFVQSAFCADLPNTITKAGFKDNILMSLPFLRNKAKVGHGEGGEEITISESFAKLAINLTATLNTFLLEQYKKKQVLSIGESAINADSPYSFTPVDDEDLPF